MTDFSHLHALEERAVRIRERMSAVQKNDAQWKSQATQLFQTEQEIADERTFLGLEDVSADDLYAALFEEAESEVVREITKELNAAEQAAAIRTAAEALMEYVEKIPSKLPLMEHRDAKFLAGIIERGANLKAALSRGWLARKEPNSMCECGVPLYLHGSLTACCLPRMTVDNREMESLIGALQERSRLAPDAPDAIAVATDQKEVKWLHNHLKK